MVTKGNEITRYKNQILNDLLYTPEYSEDIISAIDKDYLEHPADLVYRNIFPYLTETPQQEGNSNKLNLVRV